MNIYQAVVMNAATLLHITNYSRRCKKKCRKRGEKIRYLQGNFRMNERLKNCLLFWVGFFFGSVIAQWGKNLYK